MGTVFTPLEPSDPFVEVRGSNWWALDSIDYYVYQMPQKAKTGSETFPVNCSVALPCSKSC